MLKYVFLSFCLYLTTTLSAQDIEVITQQKTKGSITILSYSGDGNLLATGGKGNNDVKVWDISSGKVIGILNGHTDAITAISFDQSGTKILSSGIDNKIILWDIIKWNIIDSTSTDSPVNCMSNIQGNRFFSGHENGAVYQWDLTLLKPSKPVYQDATSINHVKQYQNVIAISKARGHLLLYDFDKKITIVDKKIHNFETIGLEYIPAKKILLSCGNDGKVFAWDIANLATSKQIKTKHLIINAFDVNIAQSIFAISTPNRTLKVYNLEGEVIQQFKGNTDEKDVPIKCIKISPDGTTLSSSGTWHTNSLIGKKITSTVRIWDIKRGIIHNTLRGQVNPIFAFDFHPKQNKMVFLGDDGILTFWDLNIGEKYGDFTLPKPRREMMSQAQKDELKNDKKKLLKKGGSFLEKALDVANGDLGSVLNKKNPKSSIVTTVIKRNIVEKDLLLFSHSGKYLITKLKGDEIRQYNVSSRKPEFYQTIFSKQPVINQIAASSNDQYIAVIGSGDSAVSIVELETGKFLYKLATPGPISEKLKLVYEAKSSAFSPDNKYLAVSFNNTKTYVWNTDTWQLVFETTPPISIAYKEAPNVNFSEDGTYLICNFEAGISRYTVGSFASKPIMSEHLLGQTLPISKSCNYTAIIQNNQLYFFNAVRDRVVKSIKLPPNSVTSASYKDNGKIGLSLNNGQFYILNPETGEDEIMLVSDGDNSIIKTKENYYKVSKEGYELVTFRIGNKAFPFEQFDAIYNRPDLVLKKLNCDDKGLIDLYHRAYQKRISKLGIKPSTNISLTNVPLTKILNTDAIQSISSEESIDLSLAFSDKVALNSYNIWINNVPVYGKKGKKLDGRKTYETKDNIELVEGINKIQIACRNKDGFESLLETFYVKSIKPVTSKNVYLVTIGTSKYNDANYNLNYAAKDAKDIRDFFTTNERGIFGSVQSKNLLDEEVTVENVLALKAFVSQAKIDDIVIVFIAGHGVLDDNFDYFFATHSMVFNDPKAKGLAYEALESLLDGIKAKKKILIMDTCHSGEIDKEDVFYSEEDVISEEDVSFRSAGPGISEKSNSPSKVMNELFNDLRRGTGATVLSSAGGTEFALESDEWKNGLFSYCLITGLKNGLADLNQDGEIYLSELQIYVVGKVKALSKGKQVPNSRVQNLELDFRIW